jgi:hypothetical protein
MDVVHIDFKHLWNGLWDIYKGGFEGGGTEAISSDFYKIDIGSRDSVEAATSLKYRNTSLYFDNVTHNVIWPGGIVVGWGTLLQPGRAWVRLPIR